MFTPLHPLYKILSLQVPSYKASAQKQSPFLTIKEMTPHPLAYWSPQLCTNFATCIDTFPLIIVSLLCNDSNTSIECKLSIRTWIYIFSFFQRKMFLMWK